jgi:hypothetical protein
MAMMAEGLPCSVIRDPFANCAGGGRMKLFVAFAVFVWGACGLVGAWMLEGSDMHLRTIARGPISLIKGYNEAPPYSLN